MRKNKKKMHVQHQELAAATFSLRHILTMLPGKGC